MKAKQILAIIGIVILVGLYVLTLIAAIFDNTNTMRFLGASIAATIIIPITLWLFIRMTKIRKENKKNREEAQNQ